MADKTQFSKNLIQKTITYFNQKYGVLLSEEETQEAVGTLSELFTSFSSLKKEGGLSAPARTPAWGGRRKSDRREDWLDIYS